MRMLKSSNLLVAFGLTLFLWSVSSTAAEYHETQGPEGTSIPLVTQTVRQPTPTDFQPMLPTATQLPSGGADDPLADDGFIGRATSGLTVAEGIKETQTLPIPGIPVTGVTFYPDRIRIPAIQLDAPVVEATERQVKVQGKLYEQWLAPDEFAAGWHTTSATLGVPGNTVLNGHNNIKGEVFGRLSELKSGDFIVVSSGRMDFIYRVTNTMILPEKYAELSVREANARWLQPSDDERLTLVSCWPQTSNTHRLIIVAEPVAKGASRAATAN